jgi:hypothetical protein
MLFIKRAFELLLHFLLNKIPPIVIGLLKLILPKNAILNGVGKIFHLKKVIPNDKFELINTKIA